MSYLYIIYDSSSSPGLPVLLLSDSIHMPSTWEVRAKHFHWPLTQRAQFTVCMCGDTAELFLSTWRRIAAWMIGPWGVTLCPPLGGFVTAPQSPHYALSNEELFSSHIHLLSSPHMADTEATGSLKELGYGVLFNKGTAAGLWAVWLPQGSNLWPLNPLRSSLATFQGVTRNLLYNSGNDTIETGHISPFLTDKKGNVKPAY